MAKRAVFTFEGVVYPEGSLKLREVEQIETLTGTVYVGIQPMRQMSHKLAMMTVFLLRDHDTKTVETIIEGMTLATVGGLWSEVDDDLPEEYEDGFPLVPAVPLTAS